MLKGLVSNICTVQIYLDPIGIYHKSDGRSVWGVGFREHIGQIFSRLVGHVQRELTPVDRVVGHKDGLYCSMQISK